MKIRLFINKDREKLIGLLEELQHQKFFKQEEISCALELIDIYLKDKNQKDYECYASVDEDESLLGYICFGPVPLTDAVFDLYWIAVSHKIHGRGVGKKLMAFMEDELKRRGMRKILAETSSLDVYKSTREFYAKVGYTEVARIKDFYSLGDDRITYEKGLL